MKTIRDAIKTGIRIGPYSKQEENIKNEIKRFLMFKLMQLEATRPGTKHGIVLKPLSAQEFLTKVFEE